jgi:hypothetical protein
MLIVAQEITQLKVKSVAISVEMGTVHAGNALLAGRNKLKKPTLCIIVSLRWAISVSHSWYLLD